MFLPIQKSLPLLYVLLRNTSTMGIGFVRIGKLAMATVGTVYTVLNVESLYTQTKNFLLPSSSYPFVFFHVILLSILFQCSSRSYHLLRQFITGNSSRNPATLQHPPVLVVPDQDQLPRGYSDIWSHIHDQESYKGHKEDYGRLSDPFSYSNPPHPFVEGDREEGE